MPAFGLFRIRRSADPFGGRARWDPSRRPYVRLPGRLGLVVPGDFGGVPCMARARCDRGGSGGAVRWSTSGSCQSPVLPPHGLSASLVRDQESSLGRATPGIRWMGMVLERGFVGWTARPSGRVDRASAVSSMGPFDARLASISNRSFSRAFSAANVRSLGGQVAERIPQGRTDSDFLERITALERGEERDKTPTPGQFISESAGHGAHGLRKSLVGSKE